MTFLHRGGCGQRRCDREEENKEAHLSPGY
jgi:hypothetical protein